MKDQRKVPWAAKPKYMESHVERYVNYLEDMIRILTEECGSSATQPPGAVREAVELEKRRLIAELEAETALANRELQELGAWQYDHATQFARIHQSLAAIGEEKP